MDVHISLAAESVFHLGPLSITNSMLVSWLVILGLFFFARAATRKVKLVPGKIQNLVEMLLEGLLTFFEGVAGKHAREFFPLVTTFFIFILFSNWSGLLPGVGTIGFYVHEHGKEVFVPLLRGATADLNTTFGLALVSVLAIHYYAFKHLGARQYLFSRFVNPIGILELMADVAKVLSFSFRLFGNIFAGEVLLAVIAALMPFFAPLPFLGLEIFVGLIQALVFTMLTIIFLSTAVETH